MNRGRQMKNSLAIRNCSSQKVSSESGDVKVLLNSRGSLWRDKKNKRQHFFVSHSVKLKKKNLWK